jgi:hypothetical protein
VLLAAQTSLNLSTLANLPAAHLRATAPTEPGIALVRASKPRRAARSEMTLPMRSLHPDLRRPKQDHRPHHVLDTSLTTAFGVYSLLLELGEPTRRLVGADAADEGSPLAGEADEQASAVVRIRDPLDEPLALEPVDEMGHPARGAHQGAVQLGRRATVRGADAAQGSQDIPARAVRCLLDRGLNANFARFAPRRRRARCRVEADSFRHSARTRSTWSWPGSVRAGSLIGCT